MQKEQFQKFNKAAVATVLAASSVATMAPAVSPKAAVVFSDLDIASDHYASVMELYNRGYISGYADGTFRPNAKVTRGHAAKMLSQALGLNITSPKNPGFTDVPSQNGYYPYVAALAEAGIISGYIDKTFRPSEPITRNQMAKILTLGYEFQIASKLTNEFKDVTESNLNKYYIQTLYDLGVTKGTTANTYSPSKPVTRGQLATFIMRAEGVSAQASKLKEIGDISGNYVYINGVKHFIDASLRSIFNEKNKAVLKGAQIEGQVAGNTLKSVSKLIINAQGTKNKLLVFDGNQSTFPGEVEIRGNYLQFKDWTLTGLVTISEEAPRTISALNPLLSRVAGLTTFGFIDWGNGSGDSSTGDGDDGEDGTLEEPSTGHPQLERMGKIAKYIDFTTSTVKRLVISASSTHVAAQNKLPHVTVTGGVRQYEVYAAIGTLYVETDVNTTMYGVGDVDTVYKNTVKNLYLNTDSYIGKLIIDTIHGWTDLGDFTYVHTAIIPPGAMPNDVFNDFINDNDKIGNIIDGNGDEVDRDPIENGIIPDLDAPTIMDLEADVDGSNVDFEIRVDEAGEYYYMVVKADERPPTIRDILENNQSGLLIEGAGDYYAYFKESLEQEVDYVLYAVAVDEAGNVSEKASLDFKTKDGTPPVINNLKGEGLIGGTRAQVTFNPSEEGRYRYMIVKDGDKAPTLEELRQQPETVVTADEVKKGVSFVHKGLQAQTLYTVYMIMTDKSGNPSAKTDSEITKSTAFWTGALDNTPPFLTKTVLDNGDITDIDREPTKVVLTFSEQLDKDTAENVKNYTLGGTGQLKDNPYKATLSADGKKVTLLIPSMAAFVNNDTLTIRIRDVEDMAGNKIVDNMTTNFATYLYKSDSSPQITNIYINDEETNPDLTKIPEDKKAALASSNSIYKNKITFRANYPGTYYYLIMPADPVEGAKKLNHYEVIFPKENFDENKVFQKNYALASGWGEAVAGDGKDLDRGNTFDAYYDPTKLESENGYYIYMVMRDRNGNYSKVQPQYFLPNKRPWDMVNFEFDQAPKDPATPNTNAVDFYYDFMTAEGKPDYAQLSPLSDVATRKNYTFKFNMKFDTAMDKASVENIANYSLNPKSDVAARFLEIKKVTLADNTFDAQIEVGYRSDIKEEDIPFPEVKDLYAYYLRDTDKLAITLENVKSWAMAQDEASGSGKPPITPPVETVVANYKDKVAPRLLGQAPVVNNKFPNRVDGFSLAYRVNPNFEPLKWPPVANDEPAALHEHKLELTFSEAIQLDPNDPTKPFDKNKIAIAVKKTIDDNVPLGNPTVKSVEVSPDKPNKVYVTLEADPGGPPQTYSLESNEIELTFDPATNLLDTSSEKNPILVDPVDPASNRGLYVYRKMPMKFLYANLGNKDEGYGVNGYKAIDGINYVYSSKAVTVSVTGAYNSPGLVVHYASVNKLTSETVNILPEDLIYDRRDFDITGKMGLEVLGSELVLAAQPNTQQIFTDAGEQIYLVVTDTYGNVSYLVKGPISVKVSDMDPNDPKNPNKTP